MSVVPPNFTISYDNQQGRLDELVEKGETYAEKVPLIRR